MKKMNIKDFSVFELDTMEMKAVNGGDKFMYDLGYICGWLIGNSRAPHYMVGG